MIMLMQPQSPNPDFDFMLKDQPPARRGLSLPNLPRVVLYGIIGVVVILLLIIVFSVFSGRSSGSTQPIIAVLARNQETLRVSALVEDQLQDPQTEALETTTTASLYSDKQKLSDYLASNKVKVSPAQLAADTDKTTDAAMTTAQQNNSLDQAYVTYLREALNKYENDLSAASKKAGPKGRAILNDAAKSTESLLNSPPLKS